MLLLLAACTPELDDTEWEVAGQMSPPPALPADPTNRVADDEAAATLGQRLFFDTGLSSNGEVACATCHDPEKGFADGLTLAEGIGTTGRHAPSVLGSALGRWYFWDGRADNAWQQALGPLENPVEHGTSRLAVAHHVANDTAHATAYESLFGPLPDLADTARFPASGRPISDDADHPDNLAWESMAADDQVAVNTVFANIGKAIAAYERKIVSGESAFDRYVAGDAEALSPSAVRGFQVFVASDCTLCHSGPEFSDREFHNLALGDRDWLPEDPDYGRYAGIQRLWDDPFNGAGAFSDDPQAGENKIAWLAMTDEQIGQFETPSLRDVALTAPYMHGGHFETLEDVVEFYSSLDEEGGTGHREHILQPLDLSAGEKADLVAFLESLTGEPPSTEWMTAP